MKYSILIPAYKAKFLKECIDSVMAQEHDDYEVIVLNDCSPQPVKEIISLYNARNFRFYENEKNVGAKDVVDNWNKLLSLAKGDYVICMGDDDKLATNALQAYDSLMQKYPNLDIYHSRTIMIDENSIPCGIQEERPEKESMYSMLWHQQFKGRGQFIGDFLFRRRALLEAGGFYKLPYAMASDWLICLIMAKDKGIANLIEPTFFYRTSTYTITGNVPGKDIWDATVEYRQQIRALLEKEPEDHIDKIYRNAVLKDMDRSFAKGLANNIATDLARTHFRTLPFWIKNRKKAEQTASTLIFAILMGIYRLRK